MKYIERKKSANEKFASPEEALRVLNTALLSRAKKANIPIGEISIDGMAGKTDQEKIEAIRAQYEGMMSRLVIPQKRLRS